MSPPLYRTVIFDCDSTLCAVEGIDELAGEHREAVERLTDAAMRGEIPLEDVYGRRLDMVSPTEEQVEALGELYVRTLVPGARETVDALRDHDVRIRIISGGLLPPVLRLAGVLGIAPPDVAAVPIYFRDGRYAGFDRASPLARSGGKSEVIGAWRAELPLPFMLVGDGVTDLEARDSVESFVAFAGVVERPAVVAAADHVLRGRSMLPLLDLILTQSAGEASHLRAARGGRRFVEET